MARRVIGLMVRGLLWALRKRDEVEIANRLRSRDWDGYAMARMTYWRRWEQ